MHKIINACYKYSLTMNNANDFQLLSWISFLLHSQVTFRYSCLPSRTLAQIYIIYYIYSDVEMICITFVLAMTPLDLCTASRFPFSINQLGIEKIQNLSRKKFLCQRNINLFLNPKTFRWQQFYVSMGILEL